jgi:hypothetical protein
VQGDCAGSWGLYPWFVEHGEDLIHPSDRKSFATLFPQGKVFRCEGISDGYLILRYGEEMFRVRPDLYRVVSPPIYEFGQRVRERLGSGTVGRIRGIGWHFKKQSPYYLLQVDDKAKSRQYFDEELEPVA